MGVKVILHKCYVISPDSGADWTGRLSFVAEKTIYMPETPTVGMEIRWEESGLYVVERVEYDVANNCYRLFDKKPGVSMENPYEMYCRKGEWAFENYHEYLNRYTVMSDWQLINKNEDYRRI